MKTTLLFTAFTFLMTFYANAQTFQNNVGVSNEHYHDINQEPLDDGSDDFIIASNLFDGAMNTYDISLKRMNQSGNVVWAQRYDAAPLQNARAFDIEVYFDLIFITGSVDVAGIKSTFIAKIEAMSGTVLDVKYYDIVSPNFNSRGLKIIQTDSDVDGDSIPDPGFAVAGFFSGCYNVDVNCANNIGFVLRTDMNLNELWATEVDTGVPATADFDFLNGITETSDGFFLTGSATGLDTSNNTHQGVLAHKINFQGNWVWDNSYIFGNSQDLSVDAYYDAASDKIYALVNYSVSHYFGVTVFDNATGTIDPVRSWYAVGNELNRYGFTIMESLTSPNNLVISGYDRDENFIDVAGNNVFANTNIFVYEFEKNTGNQVGPNYQYLVPHTEPSGDEFNFWNGQMPLIYYPDMSFLYENATGTVSNYFHVGYRRNNSADFSRVELIKTTSDKRNDCQDLIPTISMNAITTLIIQVSSGNTPVSSTPMALNVNGYNFTEGDCGGTLGTGDVDVNTGTVYPNPATSVLYTSIQNASVYGVYDAMGRKVRQGSLDASKSISLEGMPTGMYFVTILDSEQRTQTFKFIKE
ncbi:MAG: T9SS type A sorting domain-containing protein [Bacteroidetes bacterium]|nr:T9SS type A sorting domain-containing protein [Bacteroidota bacterium]